MPAGLSRIEAFHRSDPIALSEPPLKEPAPADDAAEAEPAPRRKRKPVGWSMIFIGVLVAVSATLV